MKKIVSIALFGERAPDYAQYVRALIRGHLNLFRFEDSWVLRVHVDSSVAKTEIGALIRRYANTGLCESVLMYPNASTTTPPLCRAMLWRLAPVFDADVDYVFSRDLDAPPMPRDRILCDAFISSTIAMGTVHDNVAHSGVMGGLCHFRAAEFRRLTGFKTLEDLYVFGGLTDVEWSRHGADQDVLNRLIHAMPQLTLLEHRYSGWHDGPNKNPERGPGIYACESWSTRVPNIGIAAPAGADFLGAHLGCAGYNHEAAVKFWDAHGDAKIAAAIASCESDNDR